MVRRGPGVSVRAAGDGPEADRVLPSRGSRGTRRNGGGRTAILRGSPPGGRSQNRRAAQPHRNHSDAIANDGRARRNDAADGEGGGNEGGGAATLRDSFSTLNQSITDVHRGRRDGGGDVGGRRSRNSRGSKLYRRDRTVANANDGNAHGDDLAGEEEGMWPTQRTTNRAPTPMAPAISAAGGEELGRGRNQAPRRRAMTEAHSTNNASGDRTEPTAASTRSEARGTREEQLITIATYNLSDGRLAGLESAGRAFKEGGMDIVFAQESKFAEKHHATKRYGPYDILTAPTQRTNCGGVSLFHRESKLYSLENAKVRGPNIITFGLQV